MAVPGLGPGIVPAIHLVTVSSDRLSGVDAGEKPGHDGGGRRETRPAPADGRSIPSLQGRDNSASRLALFVWLSPAFPVGAYAYSHGVEWAFEAGDVRDAASLALWLEDLADHGAPRLDVALFAAAFRAAHDPVALAEVNELAIALAGAAERRLETTAQGTAFVAAARSAWPCAALENLAAGPVAYPVAVGAAAAGHGLSLEEAAPAFALALFGNLVSAATRLGAVGQTEGQKLIAALTPRLAAMAARALLKEPEALGACAFRSDIAAMKHETQYSRLFRS